VGATTLDFACHFRVADPDAVLSGAIDIGGRRFVRETGSSTSANGDLSTPPHRGSQASARTAMIELQIAAAHTADKAQAAAADFKRSHGNDLVGLEVRIAPTTTNKGVPVFRVVVDGLADGSRASSLCARLRSTGVDCFVRLEALNTGSSGH
jgi:hypothetical protein